MKSKQNKRLGETQLAANGLRIKIITYRNANDLDIQFEDGVIVKHKTYRLFKKGHIKHPSHSSFSQNRQKTIQNRLGLTANMHCGETCKILWINPKNTDQITVQFTQTKQKVNTTFHNFLNQTVKDPLWLTGLGTVHLKMDNGMHLDIIERKKDKKLTIKWEDGTIEQHISAQLVKNGSKMHPLYPDKVTKSPVPKIIGHILRKNVAYKTDLNYYYCTCNTCKKSDIWNWKEIQTHNRLHK